jgi:hypothetical protein
MITGGRFTVAPIQVVVEGACIADVRLMSIELAQPRR